MTQPITLTEAETKRLDAALDEMYVDTANVHEIVGEILTERLAGLPNLAAALVSQDINTTIYAHPRHDSTVVGLVRLAPDAEWVADANPSGGAELVRGHVGSVSIALFVPGSEPALKESPERALAILADAAKS